MPGPLDADVRAVLDSAHLCFAATVTPDGRPSLSPKGTIRAWDDGRVFFLDLASPGTRRNLAANPWMELNVVDHLSRRGYRLFGRASYHADDDVHREAVRRVAADDGVEYPARGAVLLAVGRVAPLLSPGYWTTPDEAAMRAAWRGKRARLDEAFEAHVARRGPHRGGPARDGA